MGDVDTEQVDLGAAKPGAPSGARFESERLLMEADRMTLSILQASLSLIGFGFTINAFFNDVAARGRLLDTDLTARRLGLALLCLGLLLLALGLLSQIRYRRTLSLRYPELLSRRRQRGALADAVTAPFVTALLLLVVGLGALGSILLKGLF